MKLKEYLSELNAMVANDSSILEMEVVMSSDSEGNSFHKVGYTPTIGHFSRGDFLPSSQFEEEERPMTDVNSICLN